MVAQLKTLDEKRSEIVGICRANDVKRLDLFGSLARADSTPQSDADFLVEFNDPLRPGVFDRFLALRDALERIMGCRVDLEFDGRASVALPRLMPRFGLD